MYIWWTGLCSESQDVFIEVPAQESQGFYNGHHGENRDDIEADKGVLRTNMEGLDGVDEFHGVLHVAWN